MMPGKGVWIGLFIVAALLFVLANRGAYKGYFQNDDLDNLDFTRYLSVSDVVGPLLIPRYFENNYRPVGHLFYKLMGRSAGLNFTPYIAAIHVVHLINIALLWLLLVRLNLSRIAASAGALFFAFHMAAFGEYWKAMYVFDLLCGTFCLLSLLTYVRGHWLLSLAAFWIAYRAKEVAIMLPVVLAGYEFLLGQRRWRRLIPFFLVSLCVGIQALLFNQHNAENAYTLHFDPINIWRCMLFYSSRIFLLPYAGFAILLLFFLFRHRLAVFGALTFCALLVPMLLLPGRLDSAYLYVPLIGLALAAGSLAAFVNPAAVAVLFLVWIPWNYVNMRWLRREALSDADERRRFAGALVELTREHPEILTFIYYNGPLNGYGTRGVITFMHPNQQIRFASVDDPGAAELLRADGFDVVSWDWGHHRLYPLLRTPDTPDASYIQMSPTTPFWQLEKGWYLLEGSFRWTGPVATARLRRPADAKQFELIVNIGPEYLAKIKQSHIQVFVNGTLVGERDFTKLGWQAARWDLAPGPGGPVEIRIQTAPELRTTRLLGSAVVAFGFLPREGPMPQ